MRKTFRLIAFFVVFVAAFMVFSPNTSFPELYEAVGFRIFQSAKKCKNGNPEDCVEKTLPIARVFSIKSNNILPNQKTESMVLERGFVYEYSNGIAIADDGERLLIMREGKMKSGWDTK